MAEAEGCAYLDAGVREEPEVVAVLHRAKTGEGRGKRGERGRSALLVAVNAAGSVGVARMRTTYRVTALAVDHGAGRAVAAAVGLRHAQAAEQRQSDEGMCRLECGRRGVKLS